MSERHFRRLRDAFAAHGAEGIIDRRRGRASGRRVPVDGIEGVLNEFRSCYFDFTAKHFHAAVLGAKMVDGRLIARSSTWTKSVLQSRGLTSKSRIRGAHLRKRQRRPLPGMLVFRDGSTHAFLPNGPELDLIVTMDDATSRLLSIFLTGRDGTASSFRRLSETLRAHELYASFSTDRGRPFFFTPKSGAEVDKKRLTKVRRSRRQLQIKPILQPAGSRPDGTVVGHVAKTLPAAVAPGRRLCHRNGQPLAHGCLSLQQRPFRRLSWRGRFGFHPFSRRHPVH
jgi:hypothetical protein